MSDHKTLKEHEKDELAHAGVLALIQLKIVLDNGLEDKMATLLADRTEDPYDMLDFMTILMSHMARLEEAIDLKV